MLNLDRNEYVTKQKKGFFKKVIFKQILKMQGLFNHFLKLQTISSFL